MRKRISELRRHFNSFISAPSEFLGALALRNEATILANNRTILAGNLAAADTFFDRWSELFRWAPPRAGVNAWPEWLGPGSSADLSQRALRDAALLIAHSALFDGGDRNLRLGLGRTNFTTALERLDDHLGGAYA